MKGWLVLFILITSAILASSQYEPVLNDVNEYELLIIAKQWEYDIFDLEKLNKSKEDIFLLEDNDVNLTIKTTEIYLEKASIALIHFVSRDVQHGIQIEELNFSLLANRPLQNQRYGQVTNGTIEFPDDDTTFETEAYIFVGLGTDDMVIIFVVGQGTINFAFPISINLFFLAIIILLTVNRAHGRFNFHKC